MMLSKGALTVLGLCGLCCLVNAGGLLKIFRKQTNNQVAKKSINDYSGADGVDHFYRYEAISLYLEEHLNRFQMFHLDLFANLLVAKQMYDEYEKTDHPDREGILDALRLFHLISTINEQNSCTNYSAEILWNNFKAANNLPHRGYVKELSQRRINQVVDKALLAHQIRCKGKYFDKFDRLLKQVDTHSYESIQNLVKDLIKRENGDHHAEENYGDAESMFKFAREDLLQFRITNDMPYLIEELTTLAKGDPNIKDLEPVKHEHFIEVDYNKVDALVTKYLSKPCELYFNTMKDVFLPAELDAKREHQVQADKLAFYQGWAAFEICNFVLLDHSEIVYNIRVYKERTGEAQ